MTSDSPQRPNPSRRRNPAADRTDPKRSHLRSADQRRALKALDLMIVAYAELWRWRQVATWVPENSVFARRVQTRAALALRTATEHREVVWRALGYDPRPQGEDDPPEPTEHWDKGAD